MPTAGREHRQPSFRAGLWADRLAVACGAPADPRIVPFRGGYLELSGDAAESVRANVYPVPDPDLPFLGAHLTRTLDGRLLIGASALIAPARDAYRLGTIRRRDLSETLSWPGTWRLAARHWRAGLRELRHAASRRAFVGEAARMCWRCGAPARSPPRPASAPRLWRATAPWSTTSLCTAPSARSMSATPPPPLQPHHCRWRA